MLAASAAASGAISDLNSDGFPDLMVQIPMFGLQLSPGATQASLDGALTSHVQFTVSVPVTVVPSAGPTLTTIQDANGFSGSMWPPNGHMSSFTLASCIAKAVDNCGNVLSLAAVENINKLTADEANANMSIDSTTGFSLQSSRDGSGDGRVYTVFYGVTDPTYGGVTNGTCKFQVPHANNGTPAVDSGKKSCVGACP
jgi:hypothetical protein